MSLSRLALRLAAVEALCPAASLVSGRYPTLAGSRVYDSRMDAIDALAEDQQGHPIIVVYTEQSRAVPYAGGKLGSKEHFVDLVIEAGIAVACTIKTIAADGTETEQGDIDFPVTDRQTEAALDLHEAMIRRVFDKRAANPDSLFFKVAMDVQSIESDPLRDADKTTRLALRTIRLECKVKAEAWPEPSLAPVALTELDRLPEPLRSVALGLPNGVARTLCGDLAPLMPDAFGLTGLAAIDIFAAFNRQPATNDHDIRASVIIP